MAQVATMLHGDALATLRTLPDASVHCCVTSPPYWGLRQYLFDKAVVVRYDIPHEERKQIEAELSRRGIKPRL
jgi:DNA modification methylase